MDSSLSQNLLDFFLLVCLFVCLPPISLSLSLDLSFAGIEAHYSPNTLLSYRSDDVITGRPSNVMHQWGSRERRSPSWGQASSFPSSPSSCFARIEAIAVAASLVSKWLEELGQSLPAKDENLWRNLWRREGWQTTDHDGIICASTKYAYT